MRRCSKRLARWAGRWSPLVEVDGEDGLRLDVSGVAHLFGGERGLVADMQRLLRRAGPDRARRHRPDAGRGLGAGAVRAAARCASREALPAPSRPCRSPRCGSSRAPVQTLERLGLKTIGQLAGVPRKSLARRFREADNPLDALDRALGRKDEPLTAAPHEPPPRACSGWPSRRRIPKPAAQALEHAGAASWRAELEKRRLGARRLQLAGYRVDGSVAGTGVATAIPSREPAHLHRLLEGQGGGARSRLRLRRLRADRQLVRAAGRGAGQPGRGAGRRPARWRSWSTG